jgi:hypothetical protein
MTISGGRCDLPWIAAAAFCLLAPAGRSASAEECLSCVDSSRLGAYVAGGLGLYAPADDWRKDAERCVAIKAGIVRFNSDAWDVLEPRPGVYDWSSLDAALAVIEERGLQMLFTLPISSGWNRGPIPRDSDVTPSHFPTEDLKSVRSFARALAGRYRDRIKAYEVWNEPDFDPFWKGRANASEYFQFIQAAYAGLKEGDRNAVVLMGGLAKPQETEWLDAFLSLGGGRYFDAMNVHVYPAFSTLERALSVPRETLARHGLAKPVWITEISSTGGYFETRDRAAEELRKAVYLVKNYARALSREEVRAVVWHTLRNPGRDVGMVRDFDFGLMTLEGRPLPVYKAHEILSGLLVGARSLGRWNVRGIEAYRFAREDRDVWVVWSEGSSARLTNLPSSYEGLSLVSLDGSRRKISGKKLKNMTFGPTPVFLELTPPAAR